MQTCNFVHSYAQKRFTLRKGNPPLRFYTNKNVLACPNKSATLLSTSSVQICSIFNRPQWGGNQAELVTGQISLSR